MGGLLAVLAPIGVAYAAIATKPPHRSAAIMFFSLAALLGVAQIVNWGMTTNTSSLIRLTVVGLIGAIATVSFTEAMRYVKSMPNAETLPTSSGPADIPSSGDTLQATGTVSDANRGDTLDAHGAVRDRSKDTDAPLNGPSERKVGSSSIASADAAARTAKLRQLTNLYIREHDGISSRMLAGLELPAPDFLNAELARMGANWRVRKVNGGEAETYTLEPSVQVLDDQPDPDGLYQAGKLVALVEQSQIVASEGRVFFGVIKDQGGLVPNLPVQYRRYILDLGLPARPASPGTVTLNQSSASVGVNARIIGTK